MRFFTPITSLRSILPLLLTLLFLFPLSTKQSVGLCETDEDCDRQFPGSVCIEVLIGRGLSSPDNTRKCVPHSSKRTSCRGASRGLCPEYQSPANNFLNPVCTFQSTESMDVDGENMTLCNSGDNSKDCFFEYASKVDNETVTLQGQFVCVDLSACPLVSAFPDTCDSDLCSTGEKETCNRQGTCMPSSYVKSEKQICTCYAGFSGIKCEKTISGKCDIGCGFGGECIDGECKCYKHWKGNSRCTKCSSDAACENGGTCDKGPNASGKCLCADGYIGDTCGGRMHDCVGVDCGVGRCSEGVCYCPLCNPTCKKCLDNTCKECAVLNAAHAGGGRQHLWALALALASLGLRVHW